MSKLLRHSFIIGLILAFSTLGLHAQEDDVNFADDDFSEVELDDTELSEDDFDDVEFGDDGEEFADEDFDDIDEDEIEAENADEIPEEEIAADEVAPLEEDPGAEEITFDDLEEEQPVAEEPVEDLIEEPLSDDLTPPAVAEEDLFAEPASDEPDLDYEARLHDIYVKFHKDKTSEEAWQSIVGERITEIYTIQKNDKLWEISKTLFGDGNYWPKVWSLNSRIRNPHLITPKNRIQFVLGDESGPPAFSITEEEEFEEEEEELEEEEEEEGVAEDTNEPEIPPPLVSSRPVVRVLPPSLPKWQTLGEQGEFDELGIDYGVRKITKLKNKIPLSAYVSERRPNPVGIGSELEAGSRIASTLQYVYVEVDSGTAEIGDSLLVVQNKGEVEKAHESVSGFLGYSIEIQGEVQLVERVPRKAEKKRRKGQPRGRKELYRAIISKLVNPVSVGSTLIPGRVEYIEVSEKGPRSQVVAQFIGGQYFNRRRIYGGESIAFLNRGSNDGLEVGQVLSVRENRSIRNENTLVSSNVRPIGWVRVVKVEPNLATVIVVKAWSDILTGDLTGSGSFVPKKGIGSVQGSDVEGVDTASRTLLEELDELPGGSAGGSEDDGADEIEDFGEDELDEGDFDE